MGHLYKEPLFVFLLLCPVPVWVSIWLDQSLAPSFAPIPFLMLVVLYPVLEELVFRGFIQPWLAQRFTQQLGSLTAANIITSLVFVAAHLINHSPIWAAATFIPSLVYGFSQERYKTLLAPMALHCFYNGGYVLTTGI